MDTDITIDKIIEYYSHANEHYPISDLFMYKYQQKGNGYRELEAELKGLKKVKSNNDKMFCNSELVNQMKNYAPLRHFLLPKTGECNPSQKWHLLVSYYLFREIVGDNIEEIENYTPEDWYFTMDKKSEYKCPELCLWMVEAAMDGNIITSKDVYELFYKAVEFKCDSKGCWNNYIWWKDNKKTYWEKIIQVIKKSSN